MILDYTNAYILLFFLRRSYDPRPHVDDEQYRRLMDFTSLELESQIKDFSAWVAEMGKPQIISAPFIFSIFSAHIEAYSQIGGSIRPKLMASPCPHQVLFTDDWDRTPGTTNLSEAQHHWTNVNTALKTSLLEAVLL